jgi:hypothetical protein
VLIIRNDFSVFILSHGRPNNIKTLRLLKRIGYTGKIYIVIDNEDNTGAEYKKLYGDKVIVFDKLAISRTFDTMDLSDDRRTVVYARNACFEIAARLGVAYFLELDDDYNTWRFTIWENGKLTRPLVKKADDLFEAMIAFLEVSGAVTVAFAQGGDFIGGKDNGNLRKGILRKAMNTFFCKVDKPFQFVGRINEDVNTYVTLGTRGLLLFTITQVYIDQDTTQSNEGGMTGVYLESGTYEKSFYTVMINPSCVIVREMGRTRMRLHHSIDWEHCVPMIIREEYRKQA